MKAVVAAFNWEKALLRGYAVREGSFEALVFLLHHLIMLEEGEDSEQHLVGETLDTRHLFTPGPHDSENTTHHHKDIRFKRVSMSDVLSRLIFLIGRNAISGGGFGHILNTIQQLFSVSYSIESHFGYIM